MKNINLNLFLVILVSLLFFMKMDSTSGQQKSTESVNPEIKVESLKCEYLVNPLGIDILKPRLSWILQSTQRILSIRLSNYCIWK